MSTSNCKNCGMIFEMTDDDLKFYRKFSVEPDDFCFLCNQKRRLCFRNGRHLYRRTCDFTKDPMISMYAPNKPYTVYRSDIWWSDKWDACEYGKDIDFNRPFFKQVGELMRKVPRLALTNIHAVNSDYCNMSAGNKNCYLIFGGDFNEDSMYGTFGMHNRSMMDCDNSNDNERCYWMSDSFNCYGCQFAFDCKNCSDCAYISDCTGCRDCILCTNLTQKQHCIENEQLGKEEYERRKTQLFDGKYSTQQKNIHRLHKLRSERIVRPTHMLSSEDCSGDYIVNSKNCQNSFDCWDCQDMRDVILASKAKDTFRSGCIGDKSELCYSMQSTINAYDCRCSFSVFDSQNIEYSDFIVNSKNLFGCVCMRKKEHCILNKQYSQQEYTKLRSRLIEHMRKSGELHQFLPPNLCPFGYNESTAHDCFPLTKEQALHEGFTWYDKPEEEMQTTRVVDAKKLPDSIRDIPDDILNWGITCEETEKPFRIIKQELDFYREQHLPVPHLHPDVRHYKRFKMRTPKQLWIRKCMKCGKEIHTSFAPDRPEIVYCEECYLSTVY